MKAPMQAKSILSALVLSFLLAVAGAALAQAMSGGAMSGGALKPSNPGYPNQQELDNSGQSTANWLMFNKGYSATRYSSLDQINTSNVSDLRPTCAISLGNPGRFSPSPIVYDGIIYITTAHDTYALDATNCNKLWEYDYKPTDIEPGDIVNRGVAVYNGMVFRGTPDGHVLALDMRTGKLLWNIKATDSAKGHYISSVPIVYKNLLLIGTAGADWGANASMYAFDPETGKEVWSFNEIVPSTFGSEQAAATGGGSNWSSYTLDTSTGLIYVPVGNPAPDYNAAYRPGKNLYTDSVIVLDAMTGKLVRYYQQVPNDDHDYDTSAAPALFELNGTRYLAVLSKGGYLYVYNDVDHKLSYKVAVTTTRNQDKPLTKQGVYVCPGPIGGPEWNGPAYDPATGLLYTNASDWCATESVGVVKYIQAQSFLGGATTMDPFSKASGHTTAVDAQTGDIVWQHDYTVPMPAAVTPTAGGLVFTGTNDGRFLALNARTGKILYSFNTGNSIAGGTVAYEVNGKQYVAVAAGNNSNYKTPNASPSVYVFSLK